MHVKLKGNVTHMVSVICIEIVKMFTLSSLKFKILIAHSNLFISKLPLYFAKN